MTGTTIDFAYTDGDWRMDVGELFALTETDPVWLGTVWVPGNGLHAQGRDEAEAESRGNAAIVAGALDSYKALLAVAPFLRAEAARRRPDDSIHGALTRLEAALLKVSEGAPK